MINLKYLCRVCGLEQKDSPWGEDGKSPNFEICDCCGAEFGYEDATLESAQKHRNEWIKKGANWNNEKKKPQFWDFKKQLANIPKSFS